MFKAGDLVVRTGKNCLGVVKGGTYEVSGCGSNILSLKGSDYTFAPERFRLATPLPPEEAVFYMVFNNNPNQRAPRVKHTTAALAQQKAQCLSKLQPNDTFWVMQAVSVVKTEVSTTTTTVALS